MEGNERQELEELRRLQQLEKLSSQAGGAVRSPSLGERLSGRVDTMREAVRSDQGLPRTTYQIAGQVAGMPADVVGEGLGFLGRTINQATGGMAGQALQSGMQKLGQLPSMGGGTIGEGLPGELDMIQRWYEGLPPSQQRDIEATFNLAGFAAPFLGRGKKTLEAVKQVPKGIAAKNIPIKTSQAMRSAAGSKLQAAKESGVLFKPEFFDDYLKSASSKVNPKGKLSKLAAKGDPIDDFLDRIKDFRGENLQIDDMAEYDSLLGDLAYSKIDNMGNITSEGKKFLTMQRVLRDKVSDAMQLGKKGGLVVGDEQGLKNLAQGRAEWSRMLRMQDVERIIDNAQLMPQPQNAIKTGFRNLIKSDPKLRGYTKLEKDAILRAADTGFVTDKLKTLGSRLMPIGGAVTGGAPGALAAEAVSGTARAGATAAQLGRARVVQNLLSQPVASQVSPEIAPAFGTLIGQGIRSGVPVGAYIAAEDQPVNQLQYYQLFGGSQ